MQKDELEAWQRRADRVRGEGMRVVTVEDADSAVLRESAKPVRHFNRALRHVVERMRATMYAHNGVGLAAPQVGIGQRVMVADAGGDHHCVLVNPEIVRAEGSQTEPMEGCLSIPDLVGTVRRAESVQVRGFGADGRPVWVEAHGYYARVLQHEVDHLDGVLFTDRATRVVRTEPETKLKVAFLGSSAFGVVVLESLLEADVNPDVVVTRPDRPAGRGMHVRPTPVRLAAEEAGLCVLTPASAKDPGFAAELAGRNLDVLVTAAYGQIVPDAVLSLPRLGSINVHPSLLPRHRGPDPVRRALWNGERRTGVTVLFMSREVDAGDLLGQEAVDVREGEDGADLSLRLAELGGRLLVRALRDLATGQARPVPQEGGLATYAPKISAEEERVDWGTPAEQIAWRVRALAPSPCMHTPSGLKLLRAHVADPHEGDVSGAEPGTLLPDPDGGLRVQTGDGILCVDEVQPAGGRRMSAADYARGHRAMAGQALG